MERNELTKEQLLQRAAELESKLAESNKKFRMIAENSSDGFALVEYDKYIYISPTFFKLLNIEESSPEHFTFDDLMKVVYEKDRSRVAEEIRTAKEQKKRLHTYEYRVLGNDGSIRWIENSVIREFDENGVNYRTIVSGRDITKRKNAENELKATLKALPDILFEIDEDGVFHDYRVPNNKDLFIKPEDFLGKRYVDVLPPDAANRIEEGMNTYINEGISRGTIYPLTIKDEEQWYEMSIAEKEDGEITKRRFVVLIRDITDRIITEKVLTEQRNFLRETGTMAKVGGWILYVDSGEGVWSDEMYNIYDCDKHFAPSLENTKHFYNETDLKKVEAAFHNAIHNEKKFDVVLQIHTAKGNGKWVRSIGYPVSEGGRVTKIQGSLQDITDRVKIEEELQESKAFLEETGIIAKVGGWSLDLRTMKAIWTKQLYKMLEMDEDFEPTLENSVEFYPGEAVDIFRQAFQNAIDKGDSIDLELPVVTSKGDRRIAHIIGHPVRKDGSVVMIRGIFQDITERKKLEEEVQKSEERLRLAIESVGDGVYDWDISTDKVFFSSEWKEMLGYRDEEIEHVFHAWQELVHPEDIDNSLTDIRDHLSGKSKVYRNVHRILCKDHSYKWVLARGKVIERDDEGKAVRMIGTQTDISDRIRIEEELRKRELELQDLNNTKDRLFSIIGHDLRNPIHSISAIAGILTKRSANNQYENLPKLLNNINIAAKSAETVLEDLLTWARTQSGKVKVQPGKIMVKELAAKVVQFLQVTADNKNITLSTSIEDDLFIEADMQMIQTILRNIISNAIKFSLRGDTVSISIISEGANVKFAVEDNGTGIEEDKINRLFRIDDIISTNGTENEKGTGLGLLISKEFVELHNGNIWIESVIGEGTTVYFTIPKNPVKLT